MIERWLQLHEELCHQYLCGKYEVDLMSKGEVGKECSTCGRDQIFVQDVGLEI
jgi:hypothetical protein